MLMKSPRIALIVDHPRRDLAGLVLTAFELCQHNVTCHLIPMNLQYNELFALRPDFVLLNYLRRSSNERLAGQLAEAGIQFGLLDTEGGVWSDFDSYTELLWSDKNLLQQASVVCMWGPKLAEHLTAEGFFAAKQIQLTGCPRFDFYDPQWHSVLKNGSLNSGREKNPRILINTNYYTVNSRFASPEQNMRQMQARGWDRIRMENLLQAEKRAIEAMIDLAQNLAGDFPQAEIVIRPHPFETPETYHRSLKHLRNVKVNADGPVQPHISRATAVIQRSCTTAIEAGLATIPTFSPQWFSAPSFMPMAESVSVPCNSYAEMRSKLEAVFSGDYRSAGEIQRRIETIVNDWFFRIDGSSYKRVAHAVLNSLDNCRRVDDRLCSRYLYGLNGPHQGAIDFLSSHLRHSLRLSLDWSFRRLRTIRASDWTQTDKYFSLADVQDLTERIHPLLRSCSADVRPVRAVLARERGDYSSSYFGHSITLTCGAG